MVSVIAPIDLVHLGIEEGTLPDGEHVDVVIYRKYTTDICVDVITKDRKIMGEGTIKDSRYIQSVGTREAYQRRGVGTLVMNKLIDIGKQMRFDWVYLNTTDMGLYLYPKVGFTHEDFYYQTWSDWDEEMQERWCPIDRWKMIYHMPGRSKTLEAVIDVNVTPQEVRIVVEGEEHGRRHAWFPVIEREGQMIFRFFDTWMPLASAYGLIGQVV